METLVVKNFLVIKNASLDVKKFNIIIGSQGTGKSVLAKLLYFFKNSGESFHKSLTKGKDLAHLKSEIKNKFISIFPEYSWKKQKFEIIYKVKDVTITLRSNNRFEIIFSDNLIEDFNIINEKLIDFKKNIDNDKEKLVDDDLFFKFPKLFIYSREARKLVSESNISKILPRCFFIPASRAFFSLFYENLLSIFGSIDNNNIDPFLMEFGQLYERFRRNYNSDMDEIKNSFPIDLSQNILNGDIILKDEKCFIVNKIQTTELNQASSGQQEALPMLQTLAVLSIRPRKNFIFIEEPEAHLFPTSQANVVKLLSYLNNKNQNFFITTHSPYILSEVNNYLYAKDLIKRKLLTVEKFEKILPYTHPIDIDDISAYKIEDGVLTSILDENYSMIDSDELDKASSHASNVYNQLLEFETED